MGNVIPSALTSWFHQRLQVKSVLDKGCNCGRFEKPSWQKLEPPNTF